MARCQQPQMRCIDLNFPPFPFELRWETVRKTRSQRERRSVSKTRGKTNVGLLAWHGVREVKENWIHNKQREGRRRTLPGFPRFPLEESPAPGRPKGRVLRDPLAFPYLLGIQEKDSLRIYSWSKSKRTEGTQTHYQISTFSYSFFFHPLSPEVGLIVGSFFTSLLRFHFSLTGILCRWWGSSGKILDDDDDTLRNNLVSEKK